MLRIGVGTFDQPVFFKHRFEFDIERQIATDHRAVSLGVQHGHAKIGKHRTGPHQIGDPAHLGAVFAGRGRIVFYRLPEPVTDEFFKKFIRLEGCVRRNQLKRSGHSETPIIQSAST